MLPSESADRFEVTIEAEPQISAVQAAVMSGHECPVGDRGGKSDLRRRSRACRGGMVGRLGQRDEPEAQV